MALSQTDKNEIEVLIRKEIKDFLGNNTMKQYEDKLIDSLARQIKDVNSSMGNYPQKSSLQLDGKLCAST